MAGGWPQPYARPFPDESGSLATRSVMSEIRITAVTMVLIF
jgi:hypothetical protein